MEKTAAIGGLSLDWLPCYGHTGSTLPAIGGLRHNPPSSNDHAAAIAAHPFTLLAAHAVRVSLSIVAVDWLLDW